MKGFRYFALCLVLVAGCCAMAQEKKAEPAKAQPSQQPPILSGEQQPVPLNKSQRPFPIASGQRQLTNASEEAAGEGKDETTVFKESPSVQWIASHTGLSLKSAYWVLIIINFAIIAGLVVWGWKKNVPAIFRARTENIRKQLEEAQRASADANRRLGEIEQRLSRLDSEIADIRKRSEEEVAAEEQRINAAAEEERRKVIESAEQEIDAAAKNARRDLKAYAASLAVSLAEKKIRVDADTDEALVGRFVRDLGRNGGRNGQ